MESRDTGNIKHKKANKNAINNGQSRDTSRKQTRMQSIMDNLETQTTLSTQENQ